MHSLKFSGSKCISLCPSPPIEIIDFMLNTKFEYYTFFARIQLLNDVSSADSLVLVKGIWCTQTH